MRNLTITRRKASGNRRGKIDFYIEDPNGEIDLIGTKCRLLGVIFDGESMTFEIGNASYKLYAFSKKLGIGSYNDYIIIPEGEDDLEVSGSVKFDFFMGSPFLFDGNINDEKIINRNKTRKKVMAIMIPTMIIGFAFGALACYYLLTAIFN